MYPYVCMYVYTYVCMYIYIHTYIHTYRTSLHPGVFTYEYMYMYVCIRMYVCMYTRMYVCMYIHKYTCIHTHRTSVHPAYTQDFCPPGVIHLSSKHDEHLLLAPLPPAPPPLPAVGVLSRHHYSSVERPRHSRVIIQSGPPIKKKKENKIQI